MQLLAANGTTIPNAKVTITATSGDITKTIEATTDAFGYFTVEGLGVGDWTLNIAYARNHNEVLTDTYTVHPNPK